MPHAPVPLRVYLLLLVLGAMLPGALLTAILAAQTFSENRAVIERRLLDSAQVDALALDREFEAAIRVLNGLAASPALAAGDLAAFHAEAGRVQRAQPGWHSVRLVLPEGQQVVNTRMPWGSALPGATDLLSVQDLVRRAQPVVGHIRAAQGTEPLHAFAVRVPVMRDGRVAYALSAVIDAASLNRLVETRLPAAEEWTRTIVDAAGTVAARSRDAARYVGRPSTPSLRGRVRDGATGVFDEVSSDGTRVYAAVARGAFGWTAAVIVPRGVLDAPVRGPTIALLAGGTLVMAGTLLALLLVSRRLSRDFDRVASDAAAVAEGRPLGSVPARIAETARLQESLGAAARLLEERQRDRDAEVQRAQAARAEAERANQTKDQFLAVLGHELRNPLAPALTALELMKMRDPDTFARERQVLERQVGHMARLVNDLLDVASLERGKVALRRTRFEVRHIVDRAVDMARPLIDRQQHQLAVDVPATGLPMDGDEDRLVQVLTNLLTNAAKYTRPGGHIALSAREEGDMAVLIVEDDGPGIAPGMLPTLFDAFAQGPRSLGHGQGGLGLGLALARSLTALHGGTIHVENPASGHGSRFVVRLPILSSAHLPAASSVPMAARAGDSARRILVVDDNADACEMLRMALTEEGHRVAVAVNGPAALRAAEAFDPQVGILDIGLPGMSGYELARRLRRERPHIRLIALTGYGQPSDVEAAARAGFDSHCTKPVEVATLLAEVQAHVRVNDTASA